MSSMKGSMKGQLHLLVLFLLAGCVSNSSSVPNVPPPETGPVTLGEGDVVKIDVFREPELAGVYRVDSNGEIQFPLIGRIQLLGKNAQEVGEEIRSRLANGYLKQPQVTVFVQDYQSKKVHVLGQVKKPGTFGFAAGMTVIQAVANAGGFTKLASANGVKVTRVVEGAEQKYEVPVGEIRRGNAPDFVLVPGDIVYVPEAIF